MRRAERWRAIPTGEFLEGRALLNADLAQAPPTITSAHLLVQGNAASGIAITFSRPMAPATVENLRDYSVTVERLATAYDGFGLVRYKTPVPVPIRLKAANYDPATNTVILIPRRPLSMSTVYTVQNVLPLNTARTLTDLQGDPIQGHGPLTTPNVYPALTPAAIARGNPLSALTLNGLEGGSPGTFRIVLEGDMSLTWALPRSVTASGDK
jgi:hypothetical protein